LFNHKDLLHADEYAGHHLTKVKYAQLKMNGLRVFVAVKDSGIVANTREGKSDLWPLMSKIQHIREQVIQLPVNTVLDCELHAIDIPETSVKTLLIDGDRRLKLSPFALPFLHGEDLRATQLTTALSILESLGFEVPETYEGPFTTTDVANLLNMATQRSIEGWVLKVGHYHGWYKLKPIRTVDCVVTGVLPGEGRHAGRMGAIEVSLKDGDTLAPICKVGAGFTDADRDLIWANAGKYMGMVVEVIYSGLAANGALKFPRFKRFRTDKGVDRCLKSQIMLG